MRTIVAVAVLLVMTTPASANYDVTYYLRADVSQARFVPHGTYEFLLAMPPDNYVVTYLHTPNGTQFVGFYGQVTLPETMPALSFPSGTDAAVAIPINFAGNGGGATVAVPELSVLRRLLPRHILGKQMNAALNPPLQRATAWGATAVLNAIRIQATRRDIFVDLPRVTLEIQEWCSGLVFAKWLLLAAGILFVIGSASLPWKLVLVVVAPLIALEVNVLRVAGVGVAYEVGYGWDAKVWLGWAATVVGLAQFAAVGYLVNRR